MKEDSGQRLVSLSVSFVVGNSGAAYGGKTNQFFVKWLFLMQNFLKDFQTLAVPSLKKETFVVICSNVLL